MKLTDAQIVRAMSLLGLQQQDFIDIERAPSFEEGQKRLAELKTRVKSAFRRVALDLHPDRTNNDLAKTEDFKLVSAAYEDIERLSFSRPPSRPVFYPMPMPVMHVVIRVTGTQRGQYASTTTSTTTSSGNYWGGFGF